MPAPKSQPEYCVITSHKNKGFMGARVLSRGEPYLAVDCTVDKRTAIPAVGTIVLCNMADADAGVGTADIIEVVTDSKELKKLVKSGILPVEEEYSELVFIKETFDDKRAKTKCAKGSSLDDDTVGGAGGVDAPKESTSANDGKKPKKDRASPKGTPQAKPADAPLTVPRTSLEQQIAKLDAREGNADLDDI